MASIARPGESKELELKDTIYALSTGAPPAAIAIIRISGPQADDAVLHFAGALPPPRHARRAALGHLGETLDDALILRFPGPASATGENVAELHLHGGRSVIAGVLKALESLPGFRAAEAGEFTRRAFENGRIDLAQAEGLADLLSAETQSQRRAALALVGGALGRQVESWQGDLLGWSARVEAQLDFSDEDDVEDLFDRSALAVMADDLRSWLQRPSIERLRDGIRVAIAGPPNIGKSSLLNALTGRDVAITSPIAGTTRDLVEVPIAIGGIPFLLVDTAGLRMTEDIIESLGIKRANAAVASADLILWLGPFDEAPEGKRALLVHSKADIREADPRADLAVSVVTGEGVQALVDRIMKLSREIVPPEGEIAINERHRAIIGESLASVIEASRAGDLLIVAESLRGARVALDRITGRAGVEEMLDTLFGRFCIGK